MKVIRHTYLVHTVQSSSMPTMQRVMKLLPLHQAVIFLVMPNMLILVLFLKNMLLLKLHSQPLLLKSLPSTVNWISTTRLLRITILLLMKLQMKQTWMIFQKDHAHQALHRITMVLRWLVHLISITLTISAVLVVYGLLKESQSLLLLILLTKRIVKDTVILGLTQQEMILSMLIQHLMILSLVTFLDNSVLCSMMPIRVTDGSIPLTTLIT